MKAAEAEARARTAESMVTKNDDDLGAFVMALMKSFETLFLLRRVPVPAP